MQSLWELCIPLHFLDAVIGICPLFQERLNECRVSTHRRIANWRPSGRITVVKMAKAILMQEICNKALGRGRTFPFGPRSKEAWNGLCWKTTEANRLLVQQIPVAMPVLSLQAGHKFPPYDFLEDIPDPGTIAFDAEVSKPWWRQQHGELCCQGLMMGALNPEHELDVARELPHRGFSQTPTSCLPCRHSQNFFVLRMFEDWAQNEKELAAHNVGRNAVNGVPEPGVTFGLRTTEEIVPKIQGFFVQCLWRHVLLGFSPANQFRVRLQGSLAPSRQQVANRLLQYTCLLKRRVRISTDVHW